MAKQKYTYDEIFQRNIGIFTPEEQNKIKNLKVAIAGAGGMGGAVAYTLARLGVGNIKIADPEKFEISNLNRQFGAYVDTVGMFKADGVKQEIMRVNPEIKVETWNYSLNKSNIDKFLNDVDAVFDGLEFFEIEVEALLHRKAVENNLWVFMLQSAYNLTTFISFNPKGTSFEDMFVLDGKPSLELLIYKMFPKLPSGVTKGDIDYLLKRYDKKEKIHLPSYSVLTPTSATFVPEEFIKVIIKKHKPAREAPDLFMLDLKNMTICHYLDGKLLI